MQIVSDIFSILDSELPERWQWCTTYYMFGKNRSSVFVDYGFSTDKTKIEDGFTLNRESKSLITKGSARDRHSKFLLKLKSSSDKLK